MRVCKGNKGQGQNYQWTHAQGSPEQRKQLWLQTCAAPTKHHQLEKSPAWVIHLWRIKNYLCCLYCLQCLYTDVVKERKNALFGKGYLWVICHIKVWEDAWFLNSNSPVRCKVLFLYFVVCSYLQQHLKIYCTRISFFFVITLLVIQDTLSCYPWENSKSYIIIIFLFIKSKV